MRRTGLLVGGWVLATALAIVVGLLGVRAVSDSVTSSRPASLSPASVRAALDRAPTTTTSTPVSSPTDSAASSSVNSSVDESSASTSSTDDSSSSSSDGVVDIAPEDRTYRLVGGSVGVRFENGEAHLLWAQPNAGYTVESSGSSSNVDVRFRQIEGDHESRVKAFWNDGPQAEIEEND